MVGKCTCILFALISAIVMVANQGANAIEPTGVGDRVLMINVHGSTYDPDGYSVYETLVTAGANAVYLNLSSDGEAALLINSQTFDQIWVFDLSSSADNYPTDWQAIADWFNVDNSRAIICDGRMISSYWSGRYLTEGQKLTENYFLNMKKHGGGILLGTDHNDFHAGINTINEKIDLDLFHGKFNLSKIPVDTENPLMYDPNDMGTELFDDSSPGQTPYGMQPNGRILYTVAWHSGNPDTPGISSTIEGVIGLHVTVTSPPDGSTFGGSATIHFTAEATGGVPPYTYDWSSDLDGYLGDGEALDIQSSTLTVGDHEIKVLCNDVDGRTDDDTIKITIKAGSPPPADVPLLDTLALIMMIVVLGGLIVFRSVR